PRLTTPHASAATDRHRVVVPPDFVRSPELGAIAAHDHAWMTVEVGPCVVSVDGESVVTQVIRADLFRRERIGALEQQNGPARFGELARDDAAAGTCTDDDR